MIHTTLRTFAPSFSSFHSPWRRSAARSNVPGFGLPRRPTECEDCQETTRCRRSETMQLVSSRRCQVVVNDRRVHRSPKCDVITTFDCVSTSSQS